MKGLNKVILIGHLGKKPEMKNDGDMKRASFSLATTETYKNKNGERIDSTEWHNIVLWGSLAEIAEKYLDKGSPIYLEGRIRNRSYEDQGVKKYITEIRGDNLIMLGGKKEDDMKANTSAEITPETSETVHPEDDLPF